MRYLTKIAFGFLILITPALATLAQTTTWPVTLNFQGLTNLNTVALGCYYFDNQGNSSNLVVVTQDGNATFSKGPSNSAPGTTRNLLSCTYKSGDATQHINCSPIMPGQTVDLVACQQNQTRNPDLEKSNL